MKSVYAQMFRALYDAELFAQKVLLDAQGLSVLPHLEIWPVGSGYIVTVRF